MYLAFVLVAVFGIVAASNPCAVELEQAIFKPKACGIEYFENLACKLNYQIPKNLHFGNAAAAEFCLRFAKENQVGLSLLDAQGHNLCTFNNLAAFELSQIPRELLLRSRTDRYTIYQQYAPPNSTFVITGPEDPDLDSVGLVYIYVYMFRGVLSAPDLYNILPVIQSFLVYIRSYPISGPQTSMDLSMNEIFASITASVPYQETIKFIYSVLDYLAPVSITLPIPSQYVEAETLVFLFYVLALNTIVSETGELPPPARLNNYTKTENYMLFTTGAASIAKSFAQPLPINVYNDGLCTYSYNLFSSQGNLIRVVLSQTDLLFKKK